MTERRRIARDVAAPLARDDEELRMTPCRLPESTRRLCVIGPLADAMREMRGPWAAAGYEEPSVTVLAGLREAMPNTEVVFAEGVTISGTDRAGISAAVDLAAAAWMPSCCASAKRPR